MVSIITLFIIIAKFTPGVLKFETGNTASVSGYYCISGQIVIVIRFATNLLKSELRETSLFIREKHKICDMIMAHATTFDYSLHENFPCLSPSSLPYTNFHCKKFSKLFKRESKIRSQFLLEKAILNRLFSFARKISMQGILETFDKVSIMAGSRATNFVEYEKMNDTIVVKQ